MKRLLIGSCLFLIGSFVLGQNKKIDPSFSSANYKQSNKAAYARRHQLEQRVQLMSVLDWSSAEHKHRYNQTGLVMRASLTTKKVSSPSVGYKHPLGL